MYTFFNKSKVWFGRQKRYSKNIYLNCSDLFFCCLTNKIFCRNKFIWRIFTFPNWVYFTSFFKGTGGTLYEFDFWRYSKLFFSFFTFFVILKKWTDRHLFFKVKIIGLGYRFCLLTSYLFRIFCGFSTYIYILVPEVLRICVYGKLVKRILISGFDPQLVMAFISSLVLIKYISTYRYVGFIKPTTYIRFKTGKQR
jgi:hypothetical protein